MRDESDVSVYYFCANPRQGERTKESASLDVKHKNIDIRNKMRNFRFRKRGVAPRTSGSRTIFWREFVQRFHQRFSPGFGSTKLMCCVANTGSK